MVVVFVVLKQEFLFVFGSVGVTSLKPQSFVCLFVSERCLLFVSLVVVLQTCSSWPPAKKMRESPFLVHVSHPSS